MHKEDNESSWTAGSRILLDFSTANEHIPGFRPKWPDCHHVTTRHIGKNLLEKEHYENPGLLRRRHAHDQWEVPNQNRVTGLSQGEMGVACRECVNVKQPVKWRWPFRVKWRIMSPNNRAHNKKSGAVAQVAWCSPNDQDALGSYPKPVDNTVVCLQLPDSSSTRHMCISYS